MSNPRDPVDSWLGADVELLQPQPGTFERVSRRARRRKAIQATMTAAGAAAIIAGIAAAPGLASFLPGTKTSQSVTGPRSGAPSHPHRLPSSFARATHPGPATAQPALPGSSARLAAPAFRPSSVTFIGPSTGAVLGTGRSAACPSGRCVAIAGTNSYGHGPWYDVGAPATGSGSVSQVRFLNVRDGWAFGPSLWFTINGGRAWAQSALLGTSPGATVIDVEAVDHLAFALVGNCSATGAGGTGYAVHCTNFTLYRSVAGTDRWHTVGGAVNLTAAAAPGFGLSASLILAGSATGNPAADTGYLLSPSGAVIGGSVGGAAWHPISRPATVDCTPGGPQPDGQPTQEMVAAPKAGELYVICNISAAVPNQVYTWLAGRGWHKAGVVPLPSWSFGSGALSATPNGVLALASYRGIQLSTDGGSHWRLVQRSPGGAGARAGFSYVGMTNLTEGVAVPADPALGEIFVTADGGQTWTASQI